MFSITGVLEQRIGLKPYELEVVKSPGTEDQFAESTRMVASFKELRLEFGYGQEFDDARILSPFGDAVFCS